MTLAPVITDGPVFGPGFDPTDVNHTTWGDFTFTFSGCDAGTLSYSGIWGAGALNVIEDRIMSRQANVFVVIAQLGKIHLNAFRKLPGDGGRRGIHELAHHDSISRTTR